MLRWSRTWNGPAALLAGILLLNLSAAILYKEGGTSPDHRFWLCLAGNILGVSATALLMRLYRRMNVNLAMVLVVGGGGIATQLAFWRIYLTPLTALQVAGIALALLGTVLATADGTAEGSA